MKAICSIVHPPDFSHLSAAAVSHALRLSLAAGSKLHLLHVSQYDANEALAFPHAQRLLAQWGLSHEDDPPWTIASKLGIEVDNIRIKLQEPTQAIVDFLSEHGSDLVVLATHARERVARRRCALAAGLGGGGCIPPLDDPNALHCSGRARFRRSSQRRRTAQARVGSRRFLATAGSRNRSYSALWPPSDRRERRR